MKGTYTAFTLIIESNSYLRFYQIGCKVRHYLAHKEI